MKWGLWISYSFKTALDYCSLYRSMHFWCYDITLKKILSIEKLSLTWNKQTHYQTWSKQCESKDFCLGFFYWVVGIWQGVIMTIGTFPEPKQHPVNIEHWLKSKLAWPVLQSVHKYDPGALTTTKNGFYLVITWKLLFSSGWTFGGGE